MLHNIDTKRKGCSAMPPKAKFTREEIINRAFEMARKKGIDAVVARELGKELGTSSSPIFTAFKNMEELQKEVRKVAMREFEAYVRDAVNYAPAFKYVGMKMIEFAIKEPKLFQLLYMREHDGSQNYAMLIEELGDKRFLLNDNMKELLNNIEEKIDIMIQENKLTYEDINNVIIDKENEEMALEEGVSINRE